MPIDIKPLKVAVALMVILIAIFWAGDSVRSRSYSGDNLNFDIGRGPVTVTNPSNQPVLMQLVGNGSQTFSVSSTVEGIAGTSTKQGTGSSSRQLFQFELPSGVSEFTVTRRTPKTADMSFIANPPTFLDVRVQPLTVTEVRTTIAVAVVIVLAALFYVSSLFNHGWLKALRGKNAAAEDTQPTVIISDGGQGQAARAYGDNRINPS